MPDLDAAMAELGAALSLTWCEPQAREQAVWLPDVGATTVPLRFTYSAAGPQHVELLQGAPGSVWDGTRAALACTTSGCGRDDVAAETERLVAAGWTLRLAQRDPRDGLRRVHLRAAAQRLLVELVSTSVQPMFERWFAGGPLA